MRIAARLVLLLIAAPPLLYAQPSAAKPISLGHNLILSGSVRSRVESWNWFRGDADGDYTYAGILGRVSLSRSTRQRDWQFELAFPSLIGLPPNAIGSGSQGQAGLGATYFVSNSHREAAAIFVKQGAFRLKALGGDERQSLRVGRIEFTEGTEVAPRNATMAALKRDRIAQRLVGNFGFTHVGRSFDGALWVVNGDKVNVTAFGGRPTRGVFQVDGWGELNINMFYAAVTTQASQVSEWRAFAIGYSDYRRDRVVKTDNRPLAVRRADAGRIDLATVGGHYMHLLETPTGSIDVLAWGALQAGAWGALSQQADAFALEVGWQPESALLRPWIRGGYDYGSGDGDPDDDRHGTFFQILPTPRVYARFPFYGMMNTADAFGEVILRPTRTFVARGDVHRIRLAKGTDLWYLGGGAFQASTFGYTGRPSNGRVQLSTLYDVSADVALTSHFSLNGYYSHAAGGDVIRAIYPAEPTGRLGYVELLIFF